VIIPVTAADELLDLAARCVENAMAQLNAQKTTCGSCSKEHYVDLKHGRAHEQLSGTPEKLRRIAASLRNDPAADAAREQRRQFDEATKRATV
jgi:hypothetical protein